MRNFKPHTLSEAEEKIVNIKNTTGASALNTLYAAITNRYVFRLEVDGEVKELTRGEVMIYVREPRPRSALKPLIRSIYRVYGLDGPVLGQIYQTLVQDWRNEQVDLRRFSAPIAARNLANDIPDAGGRYAAGGLPAQRRHFPALFPLEGPPAGDADACAAMIFMPRWQNRIRL